MNFDVSSLTGGGTGIDVGAFVDQILFAERAPARIWEQERARIDSKSAAATEISDLLSTLENASFGLSDPVGQFNSRTATSSAEDVLTAVADSNAVAATHQVVVSALATTGSYYSSQLADSSTPFLIGTFDLQVGGGAPTTIVVDPTNNTLDGLAAHINGLGLGVRASVINDAGGARLSLLSETSGEAGDLSISVNTTGLAFTEAVSGTNAAFTVNGIPVSSTTNRVAGVIEGVTLNLLSASPTPVTVTISPDTEQGQAAIGEFVDAYNAVVQAVNAQFTASGSGAAPPLFGESSLRIVQENLLRAMTYSIPDNNGFVNLNSIGIEMQDDGTLAVNDAQLETALAGSFIEVQNLLQSATVPGWAINFGTEIGLLTDSFDGPINNAIKGWSNSKTELTQRIDDFDARLEFRRIALEEEFSRIDTMLRQMPVLMAQINNQLSGLGQ